MHFLKLGITALATGVLAALTMSPALAQQQPAPLTKQMQQPYTEARNAVVAKDWATAKIKLDAAAAQAKTPQDKLAIDRLRLPIATEAKDSQLQLATLNSILASGMLTPDETKQYEGALIAVYAESGDQAKSVAAFRAFVDKYGGTAEQYAAIASDAVKINDNATAVTYGNKAIEAAKAAGTQAPERYYITLLRAHKAATEMDKYYAVEETLLGIYPKEGYWKELIAARTQGAPKYGAAARLDMFRALQAAGVKLTPQEMRTAYSEATKRALSNEAVQIIEAGMASGELNTPQDQQELKEAKAALAADAAGLPKEAADALKKGSATTLANIGEAMLSLGDNAKAIELIQAGIAKGISDPAELDIAKLHLGIAQYRSGQKDAAKTIWAEIKADNGAAALAQNWTLIANLK